MVRAAVAGIGGRMGSSIAQLVRETRGHRTGWAPLNTLSTPGGKGHCRDHRRKSHAESRLREHGRSPGEADVVIDFTNAAASLGHLQAAAAKKIAMVVGSTGFSTEQMAQARELSRDFPCVLTPNMSMGVNVLFKVVADVTRLLGSGFDVEIVEAHHRLKKDAPSGTALKLAQIVAGALERESRSGRCLRAAWSDRGAHQRGNRDPDASRRRHRGRTYGALCRPGRADRAHPSRPQSRQFCPGRHPRRPLGGPATARSLRHAERIGNQSRQFGGIE